MEKPNPENSRKLGLAALAVLAVLGTGVTAGAVSHHLDERGDDQRGGKHMMGGGGPGGRFGGGPGGERGGGGMAGGQMGGQGGGQGAMGGKGGMRGGFGARGDRAGSPQSLLRSALKDQLDISDAELKTALLAAVDDALKAQEITKDQATAIRARIKSDDTPLTPGDDDSAENEGSKADASS